MSYNTLPKNNSISVGGGGGHTQLDGPPVLLDDPTRNNHSAGGIVIFPSTTAVNPHHADSSHVLIYVLVPLGALLFIAVLSFLVVFILKKSRLDKLRHHLMPLYNFDPAEEEGDWESELLEEEKEQHVALNIRYHALQSPSPTDGPKLKFTTESLEV